MPSITRSLWFDNDLEQAAEFYTSVFPNSKIESMNRFNRPGPQRPGRGRLLHRPAARRRPGVAVRVVKDRFGVSWQIVPDRLFELLGDPDPARAAAAAKAMLGMRKIVIADLEAAANEA